MTTLKLKKPAAPPSADKRRAPLRSGGLRARPTLAQAEAERAERAERAPQQRTPPRPAARPAPPPQRPPERAAPQRPPQQAPQRPPVTRPRPAVRKDAGEDALPRLSKRMSELGLASRREADEWIAAGFVSVDGVVVDQLGARVRPEQQITVAPEARQQQAARVTVLLHKPLGIVSGQAEDGHAPAVTLVTAASRWQGDASPLRFGRQHLQHLVPAGRLDIDSTGLLVLTQDGRIAKHLIGEDSLVEKEYVVQVRSAAEPQAENLKDSFPADQLERLRHGLTLDGVKLQPAKVSWQSERSLRFVLREGRKRQIRRMCELVGLQVVALKRIRIGRVHLGELPPGQWRYLGPHEKF